MNLDRQSEVTVEDRPTTGRRGPRRACSQGPVEGWESLTDTERRVAQIVSEGLTNSQAGERMFLSRHTVDFHLRQIFRKLNVHSRVGMTRVVLTFE